MTRAEQEQAALDWLGRAGLTVRHVPVIQAMIFRPRMPKPDEMTDSMVEAIWSACSPAGTHRDLARNVVTAMHAEMTKPETKEVDVWHVHYACDRGGIGQPSHWMPQINLHFTEDSARAFGRFLGESPLNREIAVTGPHKQRVPA